MPHSLIQHSRAAAAARPRLAVIGSLVAAAALAGPFAAAAQMTAPQAAPAVHHHHVMRHHAAMSRETVELRIATLHAKLGITADEETRWAAVAQVMRDNEAGMQRMVLARHAEGREASALQDLKTYERFTQAHLDGLKTLISSFEVLYAAMPATQQAVADQVFQHFGHPTRALKS